MARLIFVPQYPAPMRYQEFWFTEFKEQFEKYFDEVIVLGANPTTLKNITYFYKKGHFSPVEAAIKYEQQQIEEYMNIPLLKDDVLFLSDISFPGIFPNILYHKRPDKMYAFCHGTAKNRYDYYTSIRKQKFMVETGHSKLFDAIFVGSYYHKEKLKWNNTIVVGVPENPYIKYVNNIPKTLKKNISSVARPSIQKVNKKLEKELQKRIGMKIHRGNFNTWKEYSGFLSASRILLITSKEDTFGYTVLDALKCGCKVIAPNKFSYPELLNKEYLYDNIDDLEQIYIRVLLTSLNQHLKPRMERNVHNFYNNIIDIIGE